MTDISGIDRVVMILRQRLEARERTQRKQAAQADTQAAEEPAIGIDALLQAQNADEKVLRRAFIQTLLSQHFGPKLINDAHFQQIVEQVTQTISDDPVTEKLLTRLLADLRDRAGRPGITPF